MEVHAVRLNCLGAVVTTTRIALYTFNPAVIMLFQHGLRGSTTCGPQKAGLKPIKGLLIQVEAASGSPVTGKNDDIRQGGSDNHVRKTDITPPRMPDILVKPGIYCLKMDLHRGCLRGCIIHYDIFALNSALSGTENAVEYTLKALIWCSSAKGGL